MGDNKSKKCRPLKHKGRDTYLWVEYGQYIEQDDMNNVRECAKRQKRQGDENDLENRLDNPKEDSHDNACNKESNNTPVDMDTIC